MNRLGCARKSVRRHIAALATAALVLTLAACGGDSDDDSSDAPTETPSSVDGPGPDETPPGDEDAPQVPSAGALPECEDPPIADAVAPVLDRVDLPELNATSIEAVTNCMWHVAGDSNSLQVNLQHWVLGGDVPDAEFLEMTGVEVVDQSSHGRPDLVVATEGDPADGTGSMYVFGHGLQVMIVINKLEVSPEEMTTIGATIIDAVS